MKKYIGVKIVMAEPMTNQAAAHVLERSVDEKNMVREGYLVEYEDGYKSWSPLDAFLNAYRRTDGMSFGLAIEAAKKGRKIARKGWNGKGIYVYLDDLIMGYQEFLAINTVQLASDNPDAQRGCVPWLASQTDMLSDDWMIID